MAILLRFSIFYHFWRKSGFDLFLVRERAKQIVELLHDEKRIKSEREKAKATAKKIGSTMDSDRAYGSGGGRSYGGGYGI